MSGDGEDWFGKHVFDPGHVERQRSATEFSHGPGRVVPWVESRARAQHRNPEPSDGYGTPYFAKTPPQKPVITAERRRKCPRR